MKFKYSEVIKGIIGLVLCLASVLGIYYWESYGRTEFTKTEIVVLKESVKPLALITEEDLIFVKREVTTLIEDPIQEMTDILGKVSKHYIPGNSQLSSDFFEESGLMPADGEYIFQLPKDWIASVPSTLRRSDDAYIYPVKSSHGPSETGKEHVLDEAAIKCLKIAFVKNQANKEVQSVGNSDRLDGTSTISSIEMIASLEDITLLNNYRKEGYKFMIMYR